MTMTKIQFRKWLQAHKDVIVGMVGYRGQATPLDTFKKENNLDGQFPAWARTVSELYRAYDGAPGRVYGSDALSIAGEIIGYF